MNDQQPQENPETQKVPRRKGPPYTARNGLGWDYYRFGPDRWWRLLGFQVGFHANGRRRTFSERNGGRRPTLTLRVGRRAEMSFTKLRP